MYVLYIIIIQMVIKTFKEEITMKENTKSEEHWVMKMQRLFQEKESNQQCHLLMEERQIWRKGNIQEQFWLSVNVGTRLEG